MLFNSQKILLACGICLMGLLPAGAQSIPLPQYPGMYQQQYPGGNVSLPVNRGYRRNPSSPFVQVQGADTVPLPANPAVMLDSRRELIVQIARSQLWVNKNQYRQYVNRAYSQGNDESWCADFVSTVLDWSVGSPWGHQGMVSAIVQWGQQYNRITMAPQPGDVVLLRFAANPRPPQPQPDPMAWASQPPAMTTIPPSPAPADARVADHLPADHLAIVESINPDQSVTTIGGNEGYSRFGNSQFAGQVARNHYPLTDSRIVGFLDPLY